MLLVVVVAVGAFMMIESGCQGGFNRVERKILVVESFEEGNLMYVDRERLLRKALLEQGIVAEVQTIYLDCERYREQEEVVRMRELIDSVSRNWRPDLIFVHDDQATYSLLKTEHGLVRSVPVVFGGVNFPNWALIKRYRNVTGLHDELRVWENIELLCELFEGEYSPFTLLDSNFLDMQVRGVIAEQLHGKQEVRFSSYNDELVPPVALEEGCVLFESYFMRTYKAQQALRLSQFKKSYLQLKRDLTTERVGLISTNPSLTAINEGFGAGELLLGGYFTPIELQLEEQAELAKRIFEGRSVEQLPVKPSAKRYLLDWRVWNALELEKKELPSYVEFVNKPVYLEEPEKYYGLWAMLGTVVSLMLLVLVVSLKRERNRKREVLEQLVREKEMLSLAVRGGGTYAWHIEEDRFVVDPQFWSSMGMDAGATKLADFVHYIHPEFRKEALLALGNLNESTNQVLEAKCNFAGKGYCWWEFRFTTIRVKGTVKTLGLLLDIDQEKHYEEEMTRAREMAEKSELKQSFLTNISHEIRTPLNAIVGFTNILYSGEELEEEERELCIESINRNTELLLGLVGDVLDLSRFESGQMEMRLEQCNVGEMLEEIYHTNQVLMPSYIDFRLHNIELNAFVKVDRGRFTQVLNNFLTNAVKFTKKGRITLGCSLNEETHQVSFYVEDTGKGISREEQQMIFTRFYKHDEFAQGTGIGLSICQIIVEKLGGTLELTSELGKGSRFAVKLPYWRILSDRELLG